MISRPLSPLELFHPDGVAERFVVLGSNCPAILLPEIPAENGEQADLILLTPTDAECLIDGWLEKAALCISQKLSVDGIAYIIAPPRWRGQMEALLHRHGLLIEPPIAHLPSLMSSRCLSPLDPRTIRYAFSSLISTRPWVKDLAKIVSMLPGAANLLFRFLACIGFAARRREGRPLFHWLFQFGGDASRAGNVVVSLSWRGNDGPTVLHRFSGRDSNPSVVAKVAVNTVKADAQLREASILARLGSSARSAGARVPQPLRLEQIGGHPVLFETAIEGRSAAKLLSFAPHRLGKVLEVVTSWLEHWNYDTLVIKPLSYELLSQELITPATVLAPFLEKGGEYQGWLANRFSKLVNTLTPFVASHNDLTMWNVLMDEQWRLGIIDWETAREEALPLADFFYSITDAVAATRGYKNRLAAFESCFVFGGYYAPIVARLLERFKVRIQVSSLFAELCFHACWLHHAVNEHFSCGKANSGAFRQIVQWIAINHARISRWMDECHGRY